MLGGGLFNKASFKDLAASKIWASCVNVGNLQCLGENVAVWDILNPRVSGM